MAVSAAEKMGCCGEGDAHTSVDGAEFSQDAGGHWYYRGYPVRTGGGSWLDPLPSADGCYTIWYRYRQPGVDGRYMPNPAPIPSGGDPDDIRFYCIEIPMTGMYNKGILSWLRGWL